MFNLVFTFFVANQWSLRAVNLEALSRMTPFSILRGERIGWNPNLCSLLKMETYVIVIVAVVI